MAPRLSKKDFLKFDSLFSSETLHNIIFELWTSACCIQRGILLEGEWHRKRVLKKINWSVKAQMLGNTSPNREYYDK